MRRKLLNNPELFGLGMFKSFKILSLFREVSRGTRCSFRKEYRGELCSCFHIFDFELNFYINNLYYKYTNLTHYVV